MRRAYALALALASTAACKSSVEQAMKQLEESVDAYNHAYRWKNYERAASYLPADLRPAFIAAYEDDEKSLHIEDYRILAVDVSSEDAAVVRVRMSYTLLPDITVQKRTLTQHWHRVNGAWTLEHEDDSLRELDTGAIPKNPRARDDGDDPEPDPSTMVEVTGPDGDTLRKDGDLGEDPPQDDIAPPEE